MNQEYEIVIEVDPPYVAEVPTALLEQVAREVLRGEAVAGPLDVSVWITNANELHTLNRTYRNVDRSTDVLSFGEDADDDDLPFVQVPDEPRHLGDLAISFEHVVEQAEEYGHSRQRELTYLLTHGLLHLLGYDHETPEEAAAMRSREEAFLGKLGLSRDSDV